MRLPMLDDLCLFSQSLRSGLCVGGLLLNDQVIVHCVMSTWT